MRPSHRPRDYRGPARASTESGTVTAMVTETVGWVGWSPVEEAAAIEVGRTPEMLGVDERRLDAARDVLGYR